jgi:hypothetical protein
MWGSNRKRVAMTQNTGAESEAKRLREAMREARIETAERTGVVVDLRDAETARLEILNEALDPVFAEIPAQIELFDRGISHGEVPRLWIDVVAYVVMGRDKRLFRFVQDSRFGRKIIAESPDISKTVDAVTRYVARRLVERERALADDWRNVAVDEPWRLRRDRRRRIWRAVKAFIFGVVAGAAALFLVAILTHQP